MGVKITVDDGGYANALYVINFFCIIKRQKAKEKIEKYKDTYERIN